MNQFDACGRWHSTRPDHREEATGRRTVCGTARRAVRHRRWVSAAVFALLCSAVELAFAQDLPKLSVADDADDETYDTVDHSDATIEFVVSLNASASGEVTVDYATSDGTAIAVDDYEAASGTLTFAAGTVERTISVSLVDDSLDELPETLGLTLSDPVGATIDDGVATGTIGDDDPAPELRTTGIDWLRGGTNVDEGDATRVVAWLTGLSGRTVTVDYATESGAIRGSNDAEVGSDYTHVEGTLTLDPGETSKSIAVSTWDDAVHEGTEDFRVSFRNPQGATLYKPPGLLIFGPPASYSNFYILDDEPVPSVAIGDAADVEWAGELAFPVTLSGPIEAPMTYSTADGTAVAGEDYTVATDATLSFGPGVISHTIRIAVDDDDVVEAATETFSVHLSQTSQSLISSVGDLEATGTIRDDDGATRLSIGDASASEGDETLSFTVTRGGLRDSSVTVNYATAGATATAGEDYTEKSGTLTFASGDLRRTITVWLLDGDKHEASETFSVSLSNAVGATLDDGTGTGTGTIHDNDESPFMTIHGSEGPETGLLDFVVTLSTASGATAWVDYVTDQDLPVFDPPAFIQAKAGSDFTHREGTLTFAPGETSKTIRVQVLEDTVDEPVEALVITLDNPVNARFEPRSGSDTCPWGGCHDAECCDCGTILDDDAAELSISDASGPEDASHLEFEVSLGTQVENPVTVSYATSDATAVADADYETASGSLTFQAGTLLRTIQVSPVDDGLSEPTETFVVTLSAPVGATLADPEGAGTIIDDDDPPQVSIGDVEGAEGESAAFKVILGEASGREVTVAFGTSDGTAAGGDDYETVSGVLTFAPGDLARTVSVPLWDDVEDEPAETFSVTLAMPDNAAVAVGVATGTITDNDDPPEFSVAGGAGAEGDAAEFSVTLAGSSSWSATVSYATSDGTAVAGEDYEAASGTLTFAPGDSTRTLSVSLLDDAVYEWEENFGLELSSPTNATLGVSAATGTIIDDDRAGKAPTKGRVLLFEPSTSSARQGFVRIINHSVEAGEVLIEAIDDSGMRLGPVPLAIGAGAATHFNSDDLEAGNASKGLPDGVGPPSVGIWRLEMSSELDIEALSYARTPDGFVTSLHDTAPATAGVHRAVFLNPGGNVDQVSRLRLVNPGADDALVTITGTDDMGGMSAEVVVDVPAGTASEWTAAELESGAGTDGALGQGDGKWRLRISSDRPVVALSLIESPTGNLTNMSTLPRTPGRAEDSHAVPLFPSASESTGRQGFVRVVNRSGEPDEVRIEAFDNTVREYAPLALSVGADEVASFNSDDLELGNAAKGLTGSTGAGEGDWRLELSSERDIEVLAYIRTTDGYLTSMHDLVPEAEGAYRVVFFNPAENVNQVSVLRLVNTGDADAQTTITGVDDSGATPGTAVRVAVPAGSSRELTSAELESGEAEAIDNGALGDGHGKWRLRVASDQPILVMSLLENPTGHLTNLSTAPGRGAEP